MARQFTSADWKLIRARLDEDPRRYGLPQREYGSVLLGSFNIRKFGSSRSRNSDTWEFLADVCRSFDLLAGQEIMDDLSGLRRLMSLLGPEFSMVVSDLTGVFPGEPGLGERLGFIYRCDATKPRILISGNLGAGYQAKCSPQPSTLETSPTGIGTWTTRIAPASRASDAPLVTGT